MLISMSLGDEEAKYARGPVCGKLFQSGKTFAVNARSLAESAVSERCSTRIGYGLTHKY
jgi:hypothetical protein